MSKETSVKTRAAKYGATIALAGLATVGVGPAIASATTSETATLAQSSNSFRTDHNVGEFLEFGNGLIDHDNIAVDRSDRNGGGNGSPEYCEDEDEDTAPTTTTTPDNEDGGEDDDTNGTIGGNPSGNGGDTEENLSFGELSLEDVEKMETSAGVPVLDVIDAISDGTITDLPGLFVYANGGEVPDLESMSASEREDLLGGAEGVAAMNYAFNGGDADEIRTTDDLAEALDLDKTNSALNSADIENMSDEELLEALTADAADGEQLTGTGGSGDAGDFSGLGGLSALSGASPLSDDSTGVDIGTSATTDIGAIANAVEAIAKAAEAWAGPVASIFNDLTGFGHHAMAYIGPNATNLINDARHVALDFQNLSEDLINDHLGIGEGNGDDCIPKPDGEKDGEDNVQAGGIGGSNGPQVETGGSVEKDNLAKRFINFFK